jgi:hypothetical protein
MLRLRGKSGGISPTWATQFDKVKGIIREPGLLVMQIPQNKTESIPGWYKSENPLLSFVDSINVCRMESSGVLQEALRGHPWG